MKRHASSFRPGGGKPGAVLVLLAAAVLWSGAASAGHPAGSASAGPAAGPPLPEKIIGVKIYESPGDLKALFASWREAGINTAFVSAALQSDPEFRRLARANGIATFIIFPVFFDMEELGKHPDLAAITDKGVKAEDDWVKFICPTRRDHLDRKAATLRSLVKDTDPDGISLDFIRTFVFWEKVYPDRDPATLPNSCFDDSCLERFQKETGLRIPASLDGAAAKAGWILGSHGAEWTAWKCGVIAGVVRELAGAARAAKPGIRINVHAVPWRTADFGGAIRSVAGQDLGRIAPAADFISPMCYHHMVKQTPAWVHAVVEDMARTTGAAILPSIQVKEAYIPGPETPAEFRAALAEALRPPSRGVVFWNWLALAESREKLAAVREAARGRG